MKILTITIVGAALMVASRPAQATQLAFFVTQAQIEALNPGSGSGCAAGLAVGTGATDTCAVFGVGLTSFNGTNSGGIYVGATNNAAANQAYTATSANLSSGSAWTPFSLLGTVGSTGALEAVDTTGNIAEITAAASTNFTGSFTTSNGTSASLSIVPLTAGTSLEFIVNSSVLTVGTSYNLVLEVAIQQVFALNAATNAGHADKTTLQNITVISTATATPEPSSIGMLFGGIAAIGVSRFRRKSR
jgi:hypothetical protein